MFGEPQAEKLREHTDILKDTLAPGLVSQSKQTISFWNAQLQVVVNWCFGAGWFGFLASPYESYERIVT